MIDNNESEIDVLKDAPYDFTPEAAFTMIEEQWKKWSKETGLKKFVVGISGGIDSTCVAALACRIFGAESVCGVSLPCDGQKDMHDVDKVFEHLGLRRVTIDIGDAFHSILDGVENNALEVSSDTRTNLPARLRMSALYAVAQSLPGFTVANTCNISETVSGYDTIWGDSCGAFAPIKEYTKTEVRAIAAWLGVPGELVGKTPVDGLQASSDEDRFGYTYADLDCLIRYDIGTDELREKVAKRYHAGKFKMEICNVPGVSCGYPNYVTGQNLKCFL